MELCYPPPLPASLTLHMLFIDTSLTGRSDPEEARKLLDPSLNGWMEAVHRYEGTVNQVMGDGFMALSARRWPTRITPCGCVAALRMQEAVKRYAA